MPCLIHLRDHRIILRNQLVSFYEPCTNSVVGLLPFLQMLLEGGGASLQRVDCGRSGLQLPREAVPFSIGRTNSTEIGFLAADLRFEVYDPSACLFKISDDSRMSLKSGKIFFT